MELTLNFTDNKAMMKIDGAISSENVFLLQDKLKEVLESDVKLLEMDLSASRSMCSSAIGKILYFYKDFQERDGVLEIVKCSPSIYELFTTIKLNQLFTVNL
jgi:anti-anti-sigma factor